MTDVVRKYGFIRQDFPEWEKKREVVNGLITSFECEMSPRILFEREPLKQCDVETKKWLGDMVHTLWMVRSPVKEWMDEAEQALICADRQYFAIKKALPSLDQADLDQLSSLLKSFITLRKNCEKLSQAISRFPSKVLVV